MNRGSWTIAALAVAGLALAACGGSRPSQPSRVVALSGPTCVRFLAEHGISVQPWHGGTRACPIDTPVRAASAQLAAFAPPLETSCATLVAWSGFEDDLDRAARASLGSPVVAIRHYGSFACRAMTGNADRPSLHAQARAIDLAGFQLADGRVVTVAKGWSGPANQRRFLRAVAAAACRHFSVVLTPDSDSFHQDHIHVDIGPWRLCST